MAVKRWIPVTRADGAAAAAALWEVRANREQAVRLAKLSAEIAHAGGAAELTRAAAAPAAAPPPRRRRAPTRRALPGSRSIRKMLSLCSA